MKSSMTRREFLSTAGAFVCASAGATLLPREARAAPSNRLGAAVIGLGGMGTGHLHGLLGDGGVQVLAVCDVDADHLQNAVNVTGGKAKGYGDYREVLARDDIDVVLIATPDHWHAKITVDACEAGKDVYVEKPMCHNVVEGRAMVAAARRYNRIVQVGTQQRSQSHFRYVVELVRSGRIGRVDLARCWFAPGGGGGWSADTDPPPSLDWNFWLGPAPWARYNPARCPFNFRYFWDYAGGPLTDWGVHLIDIVQWAMGEDAPVTIEAKGTYPSEGIFETPEELEVKYEFPSFTLYWTQLHDQHWDDAAKGGYGIKFYGTQGEIFVDRDGFKIYPEGKPVQPIGPGDFQLPRVAGHWQEFTECVRNRTLPTSDVEVGHRSTSTPLLGNIAFRMGRTLRWDSEAERFVNDEGANRLLARSYRAPWHI